MRGVPRKPCLDRVIFIVAAVFWRLYLEALLHCISVGMSQWPVDSQPCAGGAYLKAASCHVRWFRSRNIALLLLQQEHVTAYICPTLLFKPTLVFYRRCYSIHFLHHLSSFNTMNQIYMRMFISLLSPGFFLMLRFYMLQWITKRGGGSSLGSSSIGSTRQHMLQAQEKS